MQLPTVPLVVLDTETTGLVPKVHKIIEFASVRLDKGKVIDTYEQLIHPGHDDIPPTVVALTRIRNDDIQGKPKFAEIQNDILSHLGDDTLIVGQNVGFDLRMLKGEGMDIMDRPWIDTSMLASLLFPELESYSLGYMSTVLKLNHEPVHRALGDVHATLELLSACWKRLSELPPDLSDQMRRYLKNSSSGYAILAEALPEAKGSSKPAWLNTTASTSKKKKKIGKMSLHTPEKGIIDLIEEPLEPDTLERLIAGMCDDTSVTHWVAVKNLEATVRRINLPKGASVLYPPFLLPDPAAVQTLLEQKQCTSDEATLATKLKWYAPKTRGDFPLHGDEKSVWAGKIAASDTSEAYTEQFTKLSSVVLLDHWQLLTLLANPSDIAKNALSGKAHIVIDDASMLEDTASRAYGWYCSLGDLYAATQGDEQLTKVVDLVHMWTEKTRQFQDVRYITPSDLQSPEMKGLRMQLSEILEKDLPLRLSNQLRDLEKILTLDNLHGRITYIEQRMDKYAHLSSTPERMGPLLKEYLYDRFSVTLLTPPQSKETLQSIVPLEVLKNATVVEHTYKDTAIEFSADDLSIFLKNPPDGKTVILMGSKRSIEDAYVKYVEPLEQEGATLICQGLSGGQGRMQAEFLAAQSPVLWVMTPWMFEGLELDEHSIDHLVLQALPFDHPSHPVLSMRSDQYQDPFQHYALPRLEYRLFRLLRTFAAYASPGADIRILDDRLQSKAYGKRILNYLKLFQSDETESKAQPTLFA